MSGRAQARARDPAQRRASALRIGLERLLIGAGTAALALVAAARIDASIGEREARSEFAAQVAAARDASGREEQSYPSLAGEPTPDTTEWSASRESAWRASLSAPSGTTLGLLSIPSIGLSVGVLEGTDDLTLNRGVGRVAGTRIESNLGISGHRDGFFRGLRSVVEGDRILLQTPTATHVYEVRTLSIVWPEDVHVLDPTPEPALTLITCFPFFVLGHAPQRFIVRAVRVASPMVSALPAAR